jgi:hypothetical protein
MGLFKDCGCGCGGRKQKEKIIISVIYGLTFFMVANHETFRLVRRVLGSWIATPTGCPSTLGLLVHTLVFILVVWGMMNIPKESPCAKKARKGSRTVLEAPKKKVANNILGIEAYLKQNVSLVHEHLLFVYVKNLG